MEIVREIHEGRATVSLTGRLDATWSTAWPKRSASASAPEPTC